MRQFRVGVGHPWRQRLVDLRRQAEQHVADDDPGMIAGNMGEARPSCHIADGKDPSVAGAKPPVGGDAVTANSDAGLIEAKPVNAGPAPRRDQKVARRNGAAIGKRHCQVSRAAADFRDANALDQLHAFHAAAALSGWR